MDTKIGQSQNDPADVARQGYDAMMRGDGGVVTGWKNKLRSAIAKTAGLLRRRQTANQIDARASTAAGL